MTSQRSSQTIDELYMAVVGLSREEQIARLDEIEISDQARAEVEGLLEADRILAMSQSDAYGAAGENTVSHAADAQAASSEYSDIMQPTVKNGSGASPVSAHSDPASGKKRIGKYRVLTHLGSGGFGQVWKAYDTSLQRYVALKVPREGLNTPADRRMLEREARAASRLQHPNIVTVFEVSFEEEIPIVACELIDGITLSKVIKQGSLTVLQTVDICIKLANAIQYAHERGIIHRDLKPANILVDSSGEPYIADFGLAKREVSDVTVSAHGNVLGTPAYMPPEQARGDAHAADSRSDIYSLGVVLFQMLTSEVPFRGDMQVVIRKVLCLDPPNPRSLQSSVPRDVETICLKCLEKSPARRYQSGRELADDLQRWLDKKPIAARPVNRFERGIRLCSRYPGVSSLALAIMAIISVSMIVVTSLWMTASENRETAVRHLERRTANFDQTIKAVETMLTKVIEKEGPEFADIQQQVIEEGLRLYSNLEASLADDPESLAEGAKIQMRIGNLHEVAGQSVEARDAYTNAIDRFKRAIAEGEHSESLIAGLGESYRSFASSLQAVRPLTPQQAKEFTDAIDRSIEIDASRESSFDRTLALARSHSLLAQHQATLGEYRKAEKSYHRAIVLWEQAAESKPDSNLARLSLVWSRHQLADMCFRQADLERSREIHTDLLQERKDLQGFLPDAYRFHPSVLVRIPKPDELFSLQRDLAATHRTLGAIAEAEQDDKLALSHYQAAADLLKQVVEDYPHRLSHQFAYSGIHLRLAQVHERLGDDRTSLEHLEEGVETRLQSIRPEATPRDLRGLAGQYVKAGTLSERLLLHHAACEHYESARDLYVASLEGKQDSDQMTEIIRLTLKVFSVHRRQRESEAASQALCQAQGFYASLKRSGAPAERRDAALAAAEDLFRRFQVSDVIVDFE